MDYNRFFADALAALKTEGRKDGTEGSCTPGVARRALALLRRAARQGHAAARGISCFEGAGRMTTRRRSSAIP